MIVLVCYDTEKLKSHYQQKENSTECFPEWQLYLIFATVYIFKDNV
jgi:hypothetical protein